MTLKPITYAATLLAVIAVASVPANAQPPGGEGGGDAKFERMMNLDENKDGKLTKDEVPERLLGMFARIDKDKDGVLTKEEVREGVKDLEGGQGPGGRGRGEGGGRGGEGGGRGGRGGMEGGPGGPGGMPMFPVMRALDANGDGEISAAEINNATAALKKLDRNKDGVLDREELRPEFGGRPGGGRGGEGGQGGGRGGFGGPPGGGPGAFVEGMLERSDKDKDGKLTGDEIPDRMRENLDRIDTNGDKVIDKAELEELAKRFQGGGGRGAGGGRGGQGGGGGERRRPPVEE